MLKKYVNQIYWTCWSFYFRRRSKALQRRMFLDLKGLNVALELLRQNTTDSELTVMAIEAVVAMARLVEVSYPEENNLNATKDDSARDTESNLDLADASSKSTTEKERRKEAMSITESNRKVENLDGLMSFEDDLEPAAKRLCLESSSSVSNSSAVKPSTDGVTGTVSNAVELSEGNSKPSAKHKCSKYSPSELPMSAVDRSSCSLLTKFPVETDEKCDTCLKLSDDSTLHVHSEVISSHSPVFSAMLSHNYADSSQPFISMKDVVPESLVCLIHHTYGCKIDVKSRTCRGRCLFTGRVVKNHSRKSSLTVVGNEWGHVHSLCHHVTYKKKSFQSSTQSSDALPINEDLAFTLDMLASCEQFMVEDLKRQCELILINSITESTVVDLYVEGRWHHAADLALTSLKYLLVKIDNPVTRLKCFTEMIRSQEKDIFLNDIKDVISKQILK